MLGPTKVNLGNFASLELPDGYRYASIRGAQILLSRTKNPVPPNLLGLVSPNSGKWWIVLTYSDVGYVTGLDQNAQVDSDIVLKALRSQIRLQNAQRMSQGMPPISDVDWAIEPIVDAKRCSLEWAVRAETRVEKVVDLQAQSETNAVINHSIRFIGRRGYVEATAVQSEQIGGEVIPLAELVKGFSFNKGERYADYRSGDKLAKVALEQFIIGDEVKGPTSPLVTAGLWTGAVLLVGGLLTLVFLMIRRSLRREQKSRAYPGYEDHGNAVTDLLYGKNGNGSSHPGKGRRREFNYQKYYADMMQEISGGSFLGAAVPVNGKSAKRSANGTLVPAENSGHAEPASQAIVRANAELIASQTHLIEEQKRLLQEQTRLIEEKNRLIQERNEFFAKQAELIERDLI